MSILQPKIYLQHLAPLNLHSNLNSGTRTIPNQTWYHYGTRHSLQTIKITQPPVRNFHADHLKKDGIFLVYIHGGAWRAPNQSANDFDAAISLILSDTYLSSRVSGLAAVNCGLSRTRSNPVDDPGRNYIHPQHIQDVLLAMHWLSNVYHVDDSSQLDYMLIGHSCGATMAYQIAAGREETRIGDKPLIKAVVGIEGIYDLPLLVKNHEAMPVYREFVEDAFGTDVKAWKEASPSQFGNRLSALVDEVDLAVVAHSPEDELVEGEQADVMTSALQQSAREGDKHKVVRIKLEGTHDAVWETGNGVYKAVLNTMHMLYPADNKS
jgi:kynurenine formamidase